MRTSLRNRAGRRLLAGAARACLCAAVPAALSGCAYYNGMYNVKRWASQAERSERAGRTGEARDRWQRAILHADSLLARHPRSRWADDALLVRGRALLHTESFDEAARTLAQAVERAGQDEQRREALLLQGRAQLARGGPAPARAALDSAAASRDQARRDEALLWRGRVALDAGDPAAALADFHASGHPAARWGRARAALALGDTAAAAAAADTLAGERGYDEADWLGFLDSLAAAGATDRASAVVDRLALRDDLGRGQRARLLFGDGDRALARRRLDAARARYDAVRRAVPDSGEAHLATVRLTRLDLEAASSDTVLPVIRERLFAVSRRGGAAAREASHVMRLLERSDSLAGPGQAPDAFWFWRAELLRDSLQAPLVAAQAFAQMTERFPRSPWTPKALVAAIAAGHPAPDSLRRVLDERYATSPYTLALLAARADASEGYALLEDSLQRALALRAIPAREPAGPARLVERDDPDERRDAPRRPAGPSRPPQATAAQPSPSPPLGPRPRPGPPRP